ncbi:MAG: P-II family nitrogen regulator [Clostridia bacterium]|nr:P-II family nitrogen regulator [Clostridia bacterium]
MDKKFELIVTVVKRGQSDKVVKASREAGATGGTIIYGRGTSLHNNDSIMGLKIQPEKEVILTLVEESTKENVMKKICADAGLDSGKDGIIFSLPVNNILGTKKFLEKEKELDKKNK